MKKQGIIVGILFLLTLIGYYTYRKMTYIPDLKLSEIKIQDLNGLPLNLDYSSGKPVVVNFWATWCGPCHEEFPAFNKVFAKYGNRVNFIMVSDEDAAKITTFKSLGMYPFMFVKSIEPLDDYGINSIPLTYFYDGKGKQVFQKLGGITEKELDDEIQKLLTAQE